MGNWIGETNPIPLCVCLHACGGHIIVIGCLRRFPPVFWDRVSQQDVGLLCEVVWLASEPQGCLPTVRNLSHHAWLFSCGFWWLDSSPHTFKASGLPAKLSPSLLVHWVVFIATIDGQASKFWQKMANVWVNAYFEHVSIFPFSNTSLQRFKNELTTTLHEAKKMWKINHVRSSILA